jgi:hypothetical protein
MHNTEIKSKCVNCKNWVMHRGLPSEAKLGSDELKTSEPWFGASVTSSVTWTESSDSPGSGSKINS